MFKFIKNISSSSGFSDEINPAREILKEATALKKEKKYNEACKKLKEAYAAKRASELMIEERLRLPMYLQLANKNDEGWRILNELNSKYTGPISQAKIANQMRVFLQNEKKYTQAILMAAWCICKDVELNRSNMQDSIERADWKATDGLFISSIIDDKKMVYGKTPKGNPIKDPAYKIFIDNINEITSTDGIVRSMLPLLKKAKKEKVAENLSSSISEYLKSSECYDLIEVRSIVNRFLSNKEDSV